MGGDDDEETNANGDTMEINQSTEQQKPCLINQLDVPLLNPQPHFCGQIQQSLPDLGVENSSETVGILPSHLQIPPVSPCSHFRVNHSGNQQMGFQNLSTTGPRPLHARSLSQPLLYPLDSLSTLGTSYLESPPSSIRDRVSADVPKDQKGGSLYPLLPPSPFTRGSSFRLEESLPPTKVHRRSSSDISFEFSTNMQPLVPPLPLRIPGALNMPVQAVKRESSWEKEGENNVEWMGQRKPEPLVFDDLFSAYMNLQKIDELNSSGIDEKLGNENREDLGSRASGTKTNGGESSDNEATSNINVSGKNMKRPGESSLPEEREGIKRNVAGDITQTTRHFRSVSMDSFMGKINFADESLQIPPYAVPLPGPMSLTMPVGVNDFSLDFGNIIFNGAELKKVMANEKLTEIAINDPKRAKRILANRESAARSKVRKMRYIAELERKVQTLQTEATTLSSQIAMLERDSDGLTSRNNELKFRLQALEKQSRLQDALNEALTGEVQRLKLAAAELSGDASKFQKISIDPKMVQLNQQQATQLEVQQLQEQPSTSQTESQQSKDEKSAEHE